MGSCWGENFFTGLEQASSKLAGIALHGNYKWGYNSLHHPITNHENESHIVLLICYSPPSWDCRSPSHPPRQAHTMDQAETPHSLAM